MGRTDQMKAAVILLLFHITTTKSTKNNAPSVHEIINEQARIDEQRPYENPLAGNSLQNAKLHAQHQQAMFNAERVRQHRAQLQRWNKAPQQEDSYMKAYHESQENHQLALEQMQASQRDKKAKIRHERPNLKNRPQLEPVKLTIADAVDYKNRNHRSYGSIYNIDEKKRNINTSPGTTYDQGVTIKPNGNIGLNNLETEHSSLYTEVVPSKTQYVYPKLYSQMHTYQSADDIHTLNSLLAKQPQEQLSELNSLLNTNKETGKNILEEPIDLFFYLNDPQSVDGKYNVQNAYNGLYVNDHANYNDHKPITENVHDIEDNNNDSKIKTYPEFSTVMPHINEDLPSTKSNYYNIEIEQTMNANNLKNADFASQHKPSYAALTYQKPLNFYTQEPSTVGVKYLQSQHSGVQHLSQDGTGVSAYGDDNIHYAANYEFGYRVRDHETGNDFGHQEAKSGDNTRGQYHVLLPDGRLQQVKYSAGPDGFHADISYDHLQGSR